MGGDQTTPVLHFPGVATPSTHSTYSPHSSGSGGLKYPLRRGQPGLGWGSCSSVLSPHCTSPGISTARPTGSTRLPGLAEGGCRSCRGCQTRSRLDRAWGSTCPRYRRNNICRTAGCPQPCTAPAEIFIKVKQAFTFRIQFTFGVHSKVSKSTKSPRSLRFLTARNSLKSSRSCAYSSSVKSSGRRSRNS